MTHRPFLELLLNAYTRQGWRDHDGSANRIAASIADGKPAEQAAHHASRTMLSRNGITREDLVRLVLESIQEGELAASAQDLPPPEVDGADVVALTAIPAEFSAVSAHLDEDARRTRSAHGTVYYTGLLRGTQLTVAVAEIGPGNLGAATEAAAAITTFEPRLLAFVGVAGSLKDDVGIGDVVVATTVHYYESGKSSSEGFQARPLPLRTGHRLEQVVRDVARSFDLAAVHIKPVAAGEQLVGTVEADVVHKIKSHYNDSVALDMESGGLYEVAHRMEIPCLSIRGVSDRLEGKTGTSDAANQPAAAIAAADFMAHLLRSDQIHEAI